MAASVTESSRFATAKVAPSVWLDSRLALVHETAGWMAVSDLHYGYELNRNRRSGALLPNWGMAQVEQRLTALLEHHRPRRLILVGDIMDGGGSVKETLDFLGRLSGRVTEVVCVAGNHDRPTLKRALEFLPSHREGEFFFHHGHRLKSVLEQTAGWQGCVHVTGHEHPAFSLSDGAGLRLKLPALVRERLDAELSPERWILPAFSPWAGGGDYTSPHLRLATWVCGGGRVWEV